VASGPEETAPLADGQNHAPGTVVAHARCFLWSLVVVHLSVMRSWAAGQVPILARQRWLVAGEGCQTGGAHVEALALTGTRQSSNLSCLRSVAEIGISL